MKNKIKEYYKTADLWLPKHSNFRVWKFRLETGKIIKIKDTIRTIKDLRKNLINFCPVDVYYSSGCFINPVEVKGNQTKNYLLFRDICFDFDADKPYSERELDVVRMSAIKLIKEIKDRLNVEPIYILFTGKKGMQVVYEFFNFDELQERIMMFNGIDPEITLDKYRVIRLPLTINKSGRLAVFLTEKELSRGINYILNKSTEIYSPSIDTEGRVRKLEKANDKFPSTKVKRVSGLTRTELSMNITNKVNGTKRFIPILKYAYKICKINPRKEIELLAKKYGLNEWYLIMTKEMLYCISPVALDKRRLEKVLNSTNSLTKIEFKKFGKIFFRTSKINNQDKPLPLNQINFNYPTKSFLYSKPHKNMLEYFNFALNPLRNYIGTNKPNIILTARVK